MTIELRRYFKGDDRVLGVMLINGTQFCYTLEPHNCIPVGEYEVRITWSPRYKRWLPEILNVPGRTGIRIHSGNYPRDTKGCVLVGERYSDYIIKSRATMANLLTAFNEHGKETHRISVTEIDYMG